MDNNLTIHFKRYKLAILYSFIVGLFIGSVPFIYRSKESFRIKKLFENQIQMEIQNKEKICKGDNSDYEKFLSLGFPKTATEKFNICMREQ